jgi:hypothetical protein
MGANRTFSSHQATFQESRTNILSSLTSRGRNDYRPIGGGPTAFRFAVETAIEPLFPEGVLDAARRRGVSSFLFRFFAEPCNGPPCGSGARYRIALKPGRYCYIYFQTVDSSPTLAPESPLN